MYASQHMSGIKHWKLDNGLRVVVDMKSEFYMAGTTIDFNDGLMERGFTFKNPMASGTCGCGSSFAI